MSNAALLQDLALALARSGIGAPARGSIPSPSGEGGQGSTRAHGKRVVLAGLLVATTCLGGLVGFVAGVTAERGLPSEVTVVGKSSAAGCQERYTVTVSDGRESWVVATNGAGFERLEIGRRLGALRRWNGELVSVGAPGL